VEARSSTPVQTGPGVHPSLLCNGYRVFLGDKERPGRDAEPSPPYSAVVKKEQTYTTTLPMGRTPCTEPQCLYIQGCTLLFFFFTFLDPTVWPDTCCNKHEDSSTGAMENTYLIALVREALPLWDQRDKKYHTRDLKPKLRDKMEEKLKFTGKY